MDVFTTLTTMATAYGYYKASVYAYDTADRTYRFFNFCKNAIGYVRTPVRYYQEHYQIVDKSNDDSESNDENYNIPRSLSCNDMRYDKHSNPDKLPISKSLILFPKTKSNNSLDSLKSKNENSTESKIPKEVGPPISKKKSGTISVNSKIKNRKKSSSMCSNISTKTQLYEDELGVNWILVKNPDYSP